MRQIAVVKKAITLRASRWIQIAIICLAFNIGEPEGVAGEIDVGVPVAAGGTVTFTISDKTTPLSVDIPANTGGPAVRQAAKVSAIDTALRNAGYVVTVGTAGAGPLGTTTLITDFVSYKLVTDTTAEAIKMSLLVAPGSCFTCSVTGILGFQGTLSATDDSGNSSIFSASFGDGTSTITAATVTYANLLSPTVDDLLTALYTQLSANLGSSLAPDLTLDLTDSLIFFNFGTGTNDPWVMSNTTSQGTVQVLESAVSPELGSLILMVSGLIGVGLCLVRINAATPGEAFAAYESTQPATPGVAKRSRQSSKTFPPDLIRARLRPRSSLESPVPF